jgi:starch phosphorylase
MLAKIEGMVKTQSPESLAGPNDNKKIERMSLVEEGWPKKIRMAFLSIVCSHTVNGVAALHSDLLKKTIFSEFNQLYPGKI